MADNSAPEIRDTMLLLEHAVRRMKGSLDRLGDDGVNWMPPDVKNGAASLVGHSCEAIRWIVSERILAEEELGSPTTFDNSPTSLGAVNAVLDDLLEYARDTLPRIGVDRLNEELPFGKRSYTVRWFLNFGLWHFGHHAGQIADLARRWEAENGVVSE